ncbi:hypothetical protein HYC85_001919 [Camellia sinensis]|uniref:Cns1/TTC4 wheel domain-containing protein n=1 Tax=Camellia sinensis TaxID=4442 RepID=A0A7J7I6Q3_CAMSI|nr:hypothetical protein HYC85_001919 [Camellia sinensis]
MALWMDKGSEPLTETEVADLQAIAALKESTAIELKAIVSAIEDRNLKIGKASFQELTGSKKPILDKDNILHWPVLILYADIMTSDIIEDFCETDMFSEHLDMISFVIHTCVLPNMFLESAPPLPWDKENNYTRDAVELYYEAGSEVCLSKKEILRSLLEGTAGSHLESLGDNVKHAEGDSLDHGTSAGSRGPSKWVKVNEKRTLYDVLKELDFVIPGIPVFYIVSKSSSFYKDFRAGKWTPPRLHGE